MIATENDALKGAKVGGIGDVIRDLPRELVPLGWNATVIIPSYGYLHTLNPAEKIADVTFPFAGAEEFCEVWRVTGGRRPPAREIEQLLIHHPSIGGDPIYYDDPGPSVFARDATKFALFCSAAGQYLRSIDEPYVLHLHDWHTGYLFLLAELHPAFAHLRSIRTVFTIHNIGYQGTRPMRVHHPSVEDWYPELFRANRRLKGWEDQRYAVPTFTPMLAGIRRAAVVTTVSPTYAREITQPSDHANAIYGGEGLEGPLRAAHEEGRLFGILNGVTYGARSEGDGVNDRRMTEVVTGEIALDRNGGSPGFAGQVPERLARLLDGSGRFLFSSITRITEQKVRLMFERGSDGATALERILGMLEREDAAYVFIGSGSDGYEDRLREITRTFDRFIFLNGFYRESAAALFRRGNLFVMPSSYEPCGITQMQAMREGQPCLVHAVGGLKDTVADGRTGFTFSGETLREKVDNFVSGARRAIEIYKREPERWREISRAAGETRFEWQESARAYSALYLGDQAPRST